MIQEDTLIDQNYHLAYVYLNAGTVTRTELVHPSLNIDVNDSGEVFGVEFLDTNRLDFTADTSLDCHENEREKFISAILCAQEKVIQRRS